MGHVAFPASVGQPAGAYGDTNNLAGAASPAYAADVLTRSQVVELLTTAKQFCGVGLFTDEKGMALLLSCAPRTLRHWRDEGKGPPWKRTTRIVYDLDKFCDWYNAGGNDQLTIPAKGGNAGKSPAAHAERRT